MTPKETSSSDTKILCAIVLIVWFFYYFVLTIVNCFNWPNSGGEDV